MKPAQMKDIKFLLYRLEGELHRARREMLHDLREDYDNAHQTLDRAIKTFEVKPKTKAGSSADQQPEVGKDSDLPGMGSNS
jgi:hypothetical protein